MWFYLGNFTLMDYCLFTSLDFIFSFSVFFFEKMNKVEWVRSVSIWEE